MEKCADVSNQNQDMKCQLLILDWIDRSVSLYNTLDKTLKDDQNALPCSKCCGDAVVRAKGGFNLGVIGSPVIHCHLGFPSSHRSLNPGGGLQTSKQKESAFQHCASPYHRWAFVVLSFANSKS